MAGRRKWSARNPIKWRLQLITFSLKINCMPRCALAVLWLCVLLPGSLLFPQTTSAADAKVPHVESKPSTSETLAAGARPVLVELFTSEGCSSCLPADALLQKMDTSQIVPNAQLIVLSEHVDYWDHDGWKDPNSSAALTERQVAYARALRLDTPYTPQFIVDGTSELRPEDPKQVSKVFEEATAAPKVPVGIDVIVDAGNPTILQTRVAVDGESNKRNADIFVAIALDRVETQVLHGENGGRRLTHVAVVLELTKIGKLQKGKSFNEAVQLKLKPGTDPKNVRIVAFVQEPGPGRLVGVGFRKPTS
jgi:hypothetical protein